MIKNKNLRKFRALPALLALGLGLTYSLTAAAFIPYQSGSACTSFGGDVANIDYNPQLGAFNKSTSASASVYCSLAYDTDDYPSPDSPPQAEFVVYDQNPNAGKDVSCTVYGVNSSGTVGYTGTTASTTGSKATAQSLYFFSIPNDLAITGTCAIPPTYNGHNSRVTTYGIQFE
jgi:hypothetical protein